MTNFNADVQDQELKEIIGIAIGEASMCWSEPPKGVFDSTRAIEISNRLLKAFLKKLENMPVRKKIDT